MARLIARRDTAEGYVFVRSGDSYPVPEAARGVLKRNGGEFSGESKEWRIPLHCGADVVAALRVAGHTVITVDAGDPRPARQAMECRACGAPYGDAVLGPASACVCCGEPLELVPAHVCTDECAALARRKGA